MLFCTDCNKYHDRYQQYTTANISYEIDSMNRGFQLTEPVVEKVSRDEGILSCLVCKGYNIEDHKWIEEKW